METIYAFLPQEAVPVWAPVDAEHVHDDVYRIVDCRGEDEEVEFGKGCLVKCRKERLSEHDRLVAYQKVSSQ